MDYLFEKPTVKRFHPVAIHIALPPQSVLKSSVRMLKNAYGTL